MTYTYLSTDPRSCHYGQARKPVARFLALILVFAGFGVVSGCASMYLGSTTASYEVQNGHPKVFYQSNKNQEGFKARVVLDENGKPKEFIVETTATTPEAAIAAALQSQLEFMKLMGTLTPLLQKAAGGTPSPPPAAIPPAPKPSQ